MSAIHNLLLAIIAYLTVISETNDEKENLSLLHETNNRLCDQVEIFDAIAANEAADTVGNDRKATAIGQVRRQIEEENEMLQQRCENASQVPSVLHPFGGPGTAIETIPSKVSSEKRKAGPTPSSAELGSRPSLLDLGWGSVLSQRQPLPQSKGQAGKANDSSLDDSEAAQRVRNQHTSILRQYRTLINSGLGPKTKTAFNIEATRAEQWGRVSLHKIRSLGFWNLCGSILTGKAELLGEFILRYQFYGSIAPRLFNHVDEVSNEGVIVAGGSSASGHGTLKDWLDDVRHLSHSNDALLDLASQSMQQSLRRELQIRLSRFDIVGLRLLESASASLGHSDLEQVAKARILVEHQIGFSVLQDHPPKKIKSFMFPKDNLLLLEKAEIIWPSKLPASIDTITSATYWGESVIVQWFKLADGFMEPSDSIYSMRNLSCFSEVLNTSLVALSLSSLHVIGYFEQTPHLFGCVYRLPPDASSSQSPVTLRELLDCATTYTVPEVSERFETSIALANTVHELHIIGLVHGDIRPENILFWPRTDTAKGRNLGRPYLIGFGFGTARLSTPRPSDIKGFTSYPCNESWYSSMSECPNNASSDLFGLAGVLFEIGCWRPLSEAERYLGCESDQSGSLKQRVGLQYSVAVSDCLFGRIGDTLLSDELEEPIAAYLHEFLTRVVDPIARCNA